MKRALPLLLPLLLAACGETKPTVPDTVKPTVALSDVATTLDQPGTLTVKATATDNVRVKEVRFYVGNDLLATDTSAPYTAPLKLNQNGTHTIKAIAVDTSGNESEPAIQTVQVGAVTNEQPKLNVTGPIAVRTTAPTEFNIAVTNFSKVTVYEGDKVLHTFTQFPAKFTHSFTSADNGTHTYRFVAENAAGDRVESNLPFEVSISSNTGDATKPVVTFGQIPATITAAGTYSLTISATDNVGVDHIDVQVMFNGTVIPQLSTTIKGNNGLLQIPVSREFNGRYEVLATAYDAAGNVGKNILPITVAIP